MISFSTLFALQRYIDTGGEVNLDTNLVAHYLLNNNADDSVGTYDGTASGDVDFQGDVAKFNGVAGTYIGGGVPFPNTTDFTISVWIDKTLGVTGMIFDTGWYDTLTDVDVVCFINTTGQVYVGVRNGGTLTADYLGTISTNTETNLIIVKTSTTLELFIDSVSSGSIASTINLPCGKTMDIGAGQNSSNVRGQTYPTDAYLSNIRVYSSSKNQINIDEIFAEGYYPKPLTEPTTTGLIAHYPLTGTAEDTTGNYDGIEVGNTYVDDIEFGSVASFDSQYIGLNNNTSWTTVGAMSFSFWIKFSNITTEQRFFVFNKYVNSYIVCRVLNGEVSIHIGNAYVTIGSVSVGGWYSINVSSDGTTHSTYINTIAGGVGSGAHADVPADNNFNIGTSRSHDTYLLNGQILNLRLYQRALTTQEITDIYTYEKNFRSIDIDDGLIAYYPLANNSLDNYYNEYDCTDTDIIYSGIGGKFNDITSFISLPMSTELKLQVFTLSCWVYAEQENGGSDTIFGMNNFNAYYGFIFSYTTDNKIYFATIDNNGAHVSSVISVDVLPLNIPIHLSIVVDTDITIYINGSLDVNSTLNSALVYDTTMYPMIGSRSIRSNLEYCMDGEIGKFRIYNKALTGAQIKVIYDSENLDNH